ncbi:MAG: beta-phosphoglucomutase [Metamycoplasmataceae bacterium]
MINNNKKGLIFDLDGVITDTAGLHLKAWQETIKPYKLNLTEEQNDKIKGLSRERTLEEILKINKKELKTNDFKRICDDKNAFYISMLQTSIKENSILPGILNLLKDAKKKKMKLAIASSSHNAPLILEKLKLKDYFDFIVNPKKITKGKPYPDIFLAAAKGLKLKPNECIGFEDSIEGIKGLKYSFIDTVGICWNNEEVKENSLYWVNSTSELNLNSILDFFKKINTKNSINKEAILHTGYGKFAYQNFADKLTVILRCKKGDVKNVFVRKGDPFDWRNNNKAEGVTQFGGTSKTSYWNEECPEIAFKFLSDNFYDYFKANIKTKTKRLRYAFEIEGFNGEKLIYTEKGFKKSGENIDGDGFTWGFLHEGNLNESPSWVKDTIWYQIFPERFANGDKKNDNPETKPWNPEISPLATDYFGGDLQGVINNLEHIKKLGCNGIYFTPIFKANTNHKYDTEDYLKIDEHFGDDKVLDNLITKAHNLGIKIMFDAVFNHCGAKFKQWLDVVKNKENSKYFDWFFVYDSSDLKEAEKYPDGYLQMENQVYETFAFTPFMPRLNWSNPNVIDYFKKVVSKWTKLGIDAWRLDVANEPSLTFWRQFRKWVKDINDKNYILGEIWYDSNLYLSGDTFDSVMNYELRGIIQNAIKENWDATKFSEKLSSYLLMYSDPIKKNMFNLLGSHDTPRFLTELKNDKKLFLFGYKIIFTMLGSPCIYYGDEIGMTGEHDPGCRKCMQWDEKKWDMEIYETIKDWIQLRKKHSSLREGEYLIVESKNKEIFIMKNYDENEITYTILNFSDKTINLNLSSTILTPNLFDALNDKKVDLSKVTIKGKDVQVYYFKKGVN